MGVVVMVEDAIDGASIGDGKGLKGCEAQLGVAVVVGGIMGRTCGEDGEAPGRALGAERCRDSSSSCTGPISGVLLLSREPCRL